MSITKLSRHLRISIFMLAICGVIFAQAIIMRVYSANINDNLVYIAETTNNLTASHEQLQNDYESLQQSYKELQETNANLTEQIKSLEETVESATNTTDMISTEQNAAIIVNTKLNSKVGVNYFNGNKETYYNLDMDGVISIAKYKNIIDNYWIRDDGVKMYGDYVIVAANYNTYPYGSIVETSLGTGIVLDTGYLAENQFDIAVNW